MYDVSYKILIGAKLLCIIFDEVDGFIRNYDGTIYLVLLGLEKIMPFMIGVFVLLD